MLNVVHGGVSTVNAICDDPAIKAISFVGGDRAGKHIYNRYRGNLLVHLILVYLKPILQWNAKQKARTGK